MPKFISLCCCLIFIISFTACSKDKSEQQAGTAKQPSQIQQQTDPQAEVALPSPTPVTGKVLETMDAAGYTYLKVATDSADKWIAVNQTPVVVGEEVTFMDGMVMQNFFSKTLDRTFPEIVFSSGLVGKDAAPASMPPTAGGQNPFTQPPGTEQAKGAVESFSQALSSETGAGMPSAIGNLETGSGKAVVPFADINVEKAPGGNSYTVGEVYSKAAELNGQTVIVRGKVMKVSPRIMGRNWIHIQDGTGDPAAKTHDLVITTSEEADADWDIITMEGVLAANKDFGAGYSYAVIIEEGHIKE